MEGLTAGWDEDFSLFEIRIHRPFEPAADAVFIAAVATDRALVKTEREGLEIGDPVFV